MSKTKSYKLTARQQQAFDNLKRAIDRCIANDIYLWLDYETLSAVNGKIVYLVAPDDRLPELLDPTQVSRINSEIITSNADDELSLRRR
jgi:hypothetical protein